MPGARSGAPGIFNKQCALGDRKNRDEPAAL
jgi:hypothetical protein